MIITHLHLVNFKRFADFELELHPRFTLLAGDNGSGKTSVLDALAVVATIWLVDAEPKLRASGRHLSTRDIHRVQELMGDRRQFRRQEFVSVSAEADFSGGLKLEWTRKIRRSGSRTSNAEAKDMLKWVKQHFKTDARGEPVLFPVLAYYGAGRAWLPSNVTRDQKAAFNSSHTRFDAYHDCFRERIRLAELVNWFRNETLSSLRRNGKFRPGYHAVRQVILRCLPDSTDCWYDADLDDILVEINQQVHPFSELSAGQRVTLALVADLAIRIVTLNAFLYEPALELAPELLARQVLERTPGLVLIDELDVHLHPDWQRRIANDLQACFPLIQYVCTSHSPQVIGELPKEMVRILVDNKAYEPAHSYGLDSSRILKEVMHSPDRSEEADQVLQEIFQLIDQENYPAAKEKIAFAAQSLGAEDAELLRARALLDFLESPV
jgi:predicted ATP-binding protein involved in virulence